MSREGNQKKNNYIDGRNTDKKRKIYKNKIAKNSSSLIVIKKKKKI